MEDNTNPPEAATPVSGTVVEDGSVVPTEPAAVINPEPVEEMTVVARNPQQMMVAQAQLIDWATRKLAEAKNDHEELDQNLAIAVKNKWRTDTLRRQANKAQKRSEGYEKVLKALQAGYVIIPNIPVDVFAIRTNKIYPKRNDIISRWQSPKLAESESPASGYGTYVDSRPLVQERQVVVKRELGKDPVYDTQRWNSEFREIDFPFATAKPQILESTAQAMALKLFDDIGISPARNNQTVNRQLQIKGDPMVIGRVLFRDSVRTKAVSFLITWFVDTRDLP